MAGDYYYDTQTTAATEIVWGYWQGTETAMGGTSVWTSWTTGTATTTVTDVWYDWNHYYPPVPQEQEAQADRERAEKLLREVLDENQIAQLERENAFEVEGESGKRYRIERGRAGNVYSLDEHRKRIARHCIHPVDFCPDADTMLAQYLWIKWNEEAFLKTANTERIAA